MTKDAGTGTVSLSVSIIGGPGSTAAALAALEGNSDRVGLLTGESPHSTANLFGLDGAEPDQIIKRVNEIAEHQAIDHLIIDCDPNQPVMAYASLFQGAPGESSLNPGVRLVRANFAIAPPLMLDLFLPSRRKPPHMSSCFVAEQVEFVDAILFDGEPGSADFELAANVARALNSRASTLSSPHALLESSHPDASQFNFAGALDSATWRKLIEGKDDQPHRDGRITAFGYHARRPFHPTRLWSLLQQNLHGVFRAKGFFWLATRMDGVGGLNLAGAELHCAAAGQWWATRDTETRNREMTEQSREQWQEPFGDRRQVIAVMALDVEPGEIRSQFDSCLLTDSEMAAGESSWTAFPDPFPSWTAHVHHHGCEHDHDDDHCCHHEH